MRGTDKAVAMPFARSLTGNLRQRVSFVAYLLGVALAVSGCAPNALDADVAQQRLDTATPPFDGSHAVRQSFVCRLPNLCQIEILPAVYGDVGHGALSLVLCAGGDDATVLARSSVDVAQVRHNVPLVFAFPPRCDSAGRTFQLTIEGVSGVQAGCWYSSVNAYGGGGLALDRTDTAGDLYFVTRCGFSPRDAIGLAAAAAFRSGWLLAPLALVFFIPGFLLAHALRLLPARDVVAGAGLSLAMSLAAVPTALLWSTVLGLRWGSDGLRLITVALALLALVRVARVIADREKPPQSIGREAFSMAAVALLVLTLAVRLLQIRGLILPAWVDSPQHVLVTQLISLSGQVPRSFEPLLPVGRFIYHFGFHADATLFHWLTGLDIPGAMLVLGQVLNAAAALMAYLLALRLTGRRLAALVALWIVGLISWMPAYYVSWGRYTQLTGLVILPAALVVSLDWVRGERRDYRLLAAAGLLQSGAFMTHARVTVYGAGFLLAFWLCESISRVWSGHRRDVLELSLRMALIPVIAGALSAPWLLQVISGTVAALKESGATNLATDPVYNAVPAALLWVPGNRELIAVSVVGAVLGLLRRSKATLWTLVWIVLVALLVNAGWIGLGATGLVNNATAIIALFLPLSVLCGQGVVSVWDRIQPAWAGAVRRVSCTGAVAIAQAALVGVVAFGALTCAWRMISIVNPLTVLATTEDLEAMEWIRLNTAPDAVFLINSRHWQLGVYVGTDGGYWVPQLTGRSTLLPALSYTYGTPSYTGHIREVAEAVSQARYGDDPRLLAVLERESATHIYIGAKGGGLKPQMFLNSSRYRAVYSTGAVWVFEFVRNTTNRASPVP